jgi:hypothetical protein
MSTSQVLKNSRAHQVQVREGSKNAQSKAVKAKTVAPPDPVPAPSKVKVKIATAKPAPAKVAAAKLAPVKSTAPVKVAKSTKVVKTAQLSPSPSTKAPKSAKALADAALVAAPVPSLIAKKRPAKAKAVVQEKPPAADSSSKPTVTVPTPVVRAAPPEHELWESDSPVMQRISLLRARNAQLSEQVQRLKKPA